MNNSDWILYLDWEENKKLYNPDWNQIFECLSDLDGVRKSQLLLVNTQKKHSLMAGGGRNNQYVVSYFPDSSGEVSLQLTDLSVNGPDIPVIVSQPSKYPARLIITLEQVKSVFKSFFETQEILKKFYWE